MLYPLSVHILQSANISSENFDMKQENQSKQSKAVSPVIFVAFCEQMVPNQAQQVPCRTSSKGKFMAETGIASILAEKLGFEFLQFEIEACLIGYL